MSLKRLTQTSITRLKQGACFSMENPQHSLRNCDDDNNEYSISEFLNEMPNNISGVAPYSPGHLWVFWMEDCEESERFQILTSTSLADSLSIKVKIISILQQLAFLVNQIALLQFWAPKIIDGETYLTTFDQPFALTKLHRGLCFYRKHCLNYTVNAKSDEHVGPVGRAYQSRLLESTPDVQYYVDPHFPLRDHASRCDVGEYLAIPVFEFPGLHCVGVLELIFTSTGYFTQYEINQIQTAFQAFNLKCLGCQSYKQISTYQPQAANEIDEMLKVVVQKHRLRFAQLWTPCKHFDPILNGNNGWNEKIMLRTTNTHYSLDELDYDIMSFRRACELSHIQIGNGVVGRASASYGSCFCIDISDFNCMEYPVVHYARKYGFKASFAICLQSSYIGDDNVYIVEFFLPSNQLNKREPQSFLESLVATMKQSLTNFQLASGKEAKEKLFVEVIDFFGPNLYETWHTIVHPTRAGTIQRSEQMRYPEVPDYEYLVGVTATDNEIIDDKKQTEIVGSSSMFELSVDISTGNFSNTETRLVGPDTSGVDPSCVEPTLMYLEDCRSEGQSINVGKARDSPPVRAMQESDALKNESDIVNEVEKVIVVNYTETESLKNTSGTGREHGIDRKVLEQHFGMKLADVADNFGISKSTLKRICRKNNIPRWPQPKRSKDNRFVTLLEPIPDAEIEFPELPLRLYTSFNTQPEIAADSMLDDVMMQIQKTMTIKATYGGDIIKFQLGLSSTMLDLEEEIAKRLKLELGNFNIKYLDEDDEWILLCCSADLKYCISTSSSLGRKTVKMLIQLVNN